MKKLTLSLSKLEILSNQEKIIIPLLIDPIPVKIKFLFCVGKVFKLNILFFILCLSFLDR